MQMDDVAVVVRQDLNFYMPCAANVPFQKHRVVAECRCRLVSSFLQTGH
jgi:hypothetical protein